MATVELLVAAGWKVVAALVVSGTGARIEGKTPRVGDRSSRWGLSYGTDGWIKYFSFKTIPTSLLIPIPIFKLHSRYSANFAHARPYARTATDSLIIVFCTVEISFLHKPV